MTLSEEEMCDSYELNDCIDWMTKNNYLSICLQFSNDCLEYSSRICLFLKRRTNRQFYISYSTMCCVDYLSAQHLNESTVDSIIYFGSVCLTSSQFSDSLPILYVFPKNVESESLELIETSIIEMESKNVIILYDTSNTLMALELIKHFEEREGIKPYLTIAKLNAISRKWNFTESVLSVVQSLEANASPFVLGPFSLPNKIENYDLVVYLGLCKSLELILNCKHILEIEPKKKTKQVIYANKELRKRVALIEKFKQNSCQSIGIVFTNPLPNVNQFFSQSKKFCKKLKKKVYMISLLQTIDEYKLGNFSDMNAFVVVNSCYCFSAIDSIDYCFPVLSWTEFEIASGVPKQYGGVQWNQSPDQLLDDSDEESDVNDLDKQLIQTEVFLKDKWFGLEVNAGDREASVIKSGQKGIASAYENENVF